MRWRRPRFWVDRFKGFNYELTWQERRNLVLARLENADFGWWIVFVAGLGFLSDAYDIFVINTVIPMLGTVYWEGALPIRYQLAMNVSTLLGSMLGQVVLGILADIYGRRKVYGLELIVTVVASLGFAASSPGVNYSMSMIAWLIFWRMLMGVSIGADYPLSSVITAEFAPTKHRARMMAAVFFFQPFGQLLATLFALAGTEGFRRYILKNHDPTSCSINSIDLDGRRCAQTVDRVWRLVSGLGIFPAGLAIVSRLTIPESVYWVLDVKNDSNQAMETKDYWPENLADQEGGSTQLGQITPDLRGMMMNEEVELGDDVAAANSVPFQDISRHDDIHQLGPSTQAEYQNPHGVFSLPPDTSDTTIYEDPFPQEQSLQNFREFLFGTKKSPTRGSWPDLFATSVNWMLLDFAFYLLGVNSSRLIPDIFSTPTLQGPYSALVSNEWHTLVATSIGAVIGGAIAIKIMKHFSRKKIQMWSFLGLGVLFVVVGALYITLLGKNGSPVIVAVYVFCQMLFNIGPNTTTFIIPAEAFPTRYRCTCHGISAATGKLGSVLGQILITKLVDDKTHDKRVGYLFISFFAVMVIGAIITKYLTPETCDIWGKSRTLESLSHGRASREKLSLEEKEQNHSLRPQ